MTVTYYSQYKQDKWLYENFFTNKSNETNVRDLLISKGSRWIDHGQQTDDVYLKAG